MSRYASFHLFISGLVEIHEGVFLLKDAAGKTIGHLVVRPIKNHMNGDVVGAFEWWDIVTSSTNNDYAPFPAGGDVQVTFDHQPGEGAGYAPPPARSAADVTFQRWFHQAYMQG